MALTSVRLVSLEKCFIINLPVSIGGDFIGISLFGEIGLSSFGITEIGDDCEKEINEDESDFNEVTSTRLSLELLLSEHELRNRDQNCRQGRNGCKIIFQVKTFSLVKTQLFSYLRRRR